MSTEIKVNNCFVFTFKSENFATFTFVVTDTFNLQSKTSKDFLTREGGQGGSGYGDKGCGSGVEGVVRGWKQG